MRKQFNRRLQFALFLSLTFLVSTCAVFATDLPDITQVKKTETAAEVVTVDAVSNPLNVDKAENVQITTEPMSDRLDKASDVKPYDIDNLPKESLPEPKSEALKLVFMFLKVVTGVVVSALAIFFFALFFKKFASPKIIAAQEDDVKDNLKSSTSDSEALKTFLSKTKNR